MKNILLATLYLLCGSLPLLHGQTDTTDRPMRRHFVSTSAFMLVNLLPINDPPRFFQVNVGYRITSRDVLIAEAITWQYFAPLGIPYGPSYGDSQAFFPGIVRDYGVGLAYQRFWWKGLYTTAHATPFIQQYLRPDKTVIQTGFQLFLTGRAGYHLTLFGDRCFVEPSVAFTHWPVNTHMPAAFQAQEDRWPNYFLFEPGLHCGVKF
ncbi:MAG: hypothetical protein OHK0039_18840 [Bacteroidia bacterium]